MPNIIKVMPKADAFHSFGDDGRDSHWMINYYCPNCNKPINKGDIACDKCGTFFDWSKTAHVKMIPTIVWE